MLCTCVSYRLVLFVRIHCFYRFFLLLSCDFWQILRNSEDCFSLIHDDNVDMYKNVIQHVILCVIFYDITWVHNSVSINTKKKHEQTATEGNYYKKKECKSLALSLLRSLLSPNRFKLIALIIKEFCPRLKLSIKMKRVKYSRVRGAE